MKTKSPPKKATDIALIAQFRRGNTEAFEELVERYENKVYALALRYTRNQEDAEEVSQDVFTTLYRKAASFEGKAQFSSWLYRVVVNTAFMKLRKRKSSSKVSYLEDIPVYAQEDFFDSMQSRIQPSDAVTLSGELQHIMKGAISRLPQEYSSVFILRDVDGMSNEEVSSLLGVSVPAVKSRLHRARQMLQKKLRGYYLDYTGDKPMKRYETEETVPPKS